MLAGLRGAAGPDNRTVVHIPEPQHKNSQEGKVAIVAIYRNESADIEEWIDYHRLIGVEKFFLYDNETTDDTNLKLRRYVQSGHVEIMPWPHFMRDTNTQAAAYAHAIARLAGRFQWLGMIDIDEFLQSNDFRRLNDKGRDVYAIDGRVVADRVLRFETLEQDLGRTMRELGIDTPVVLTRFKSTQRPKGDFAAMLNDRQRQVIRDTFAFDIEQFGYTV